MNAVRGLPFTGHHDSRKQSTYKGTRGRAYVAWLAEPRNVEEFFRRVNAARERKMRERSR